MGEAAAYRLGVRDGDFGWVKEGAITALYYYTIKHWKDNGYKKLNLGGSRPFFSDGVLNYKFKNWNMKIDGSQTIYIFSLKPLKKSSFVENFLSENAFITLNGRQMVANVFLNTSKGKDSFKKGHKDYRKRGLQHIEIHNLCRNALSGDSGRQC